MFERERRLYADNYGYARQLVVDVPDEQLAEQPTPGLNHPAWILGHLATVADYVVTLLGGPTAVPDGWAALFSTGSVPSPERGLYPSKAELLNAFEVAHGGLAAAAASLDPATAGQPNPVEGLRPRFPTVADLVAFVLTTHEAVHLGQLSAWRRVTGLKGVMG